MTKREGPRIEILLRRLAEIPHWFRRESLSGEGLPREIDPIAIVRDLLSDLGCENPRLLYPEPITPPKTTAATSAEQTRLTLILAWLLHDGWFRERRGEFVEKAIDIFQTTPARFSGVVKPDRFIDDPERREELARLCLDILGLRPAGETDEQASDRLASLDSVERGKVIREARAAEKRAREVREAMARKAAQEAAPTYGRE